MGVSLKTLSLKPFFIMEIKFNHEAKKLSESINIDIEQLLEKVAKFTTEMLDFEGKRSQLLEKLSKEFKDEEILFLAHEYLDSKFKSAILKTFMDEII